MAEPIVAAPEARRALPRRGKRRSTGPAPGPLRLSRSRRGQTLVLALAILFLMILLGGTFVIMVARNLQRATRHTETDQSLTLALAGLQFAADQFRNSPAGADWRPTPAELLWKTPNPPALPPLPLNPPHPTFGPDLDAAELRRLDPDWVWLDPDPNGPNRGFPYVRFAHGRGRFLLRVTYLPSFKPGSSASAAPDQFDPNSAMIHIESIGRPGEFDPNDPTSFALDPTTAAPQPGVIRGPYRKAEAFIPVGLVDQLWWVTNFTNERTPARLGVPPFRDGNDRLVEYPAVYVGAIRSNTDLHIGGNAVIRVYPARGEGVFVKGDLRIGERNTPTAEVVAAVQPLDDDGDSAPEDDQNDDPSDDVLLTAPAQGLLRESGPNFNTVPVTLPGGRTRHLVIDEAFARGRAGVEAQSVRFYEAPRFDQADPATGVGRWHALTRDSGGVVRVPDGAGTRTINLGAYGLTDRSLPPNLRARGLYLPNFGDIQYPGDRRAVKDEWRQRGPSDVRRRGWLGDYYVPSVVEQGVQHPIMELYFTSVPQDPSDPNSPRVPKILVTRFDLDQRQMNFAPATGRQALFYRYDPATGAMLPEGASRYFDYPENGVIFCEGSVRVRGTIGLASLPKQVTLVSGGTIYIEGNLLKGHPASFLGLLAKDYVCLNPTAFTRIRPGADVVVEADTLDSNGNPTGYHFSIPQGGDLDFSFSDAGQLQVQGQNIPIAMLLLKHSAVQEDATSETAITINHPSTQAGWPDWNRDRMDFGKSRLPLPLPTDPNNLFYLFHTLSAAGPVQWWESNYQTVNGSPANFERKAFALDRIASTAQDVLPSGQDAWFRLVVGPKDGPDRNGDGQPDPEMSPNGQPYWLSRVAVLPLGRPQRIQIEAVIYAHTGSWFIIPPPFFNDNPEDTRESFMGRGVRAAGTFPSDTADYPFYNEALNIEVEVRGAISENVSAEPAEAQSWTNHVWVVTPNYDPMADVQERRVDSNGQPVTFRPNVLYRYDSNLRRMLRLRYSRPFTDANGVYREEEVVWAAPPPPGGIPGGLRTLPAALSDAFAHNSYAETLPVLPHLPTSAMLYEGNPP